MKKVLIFGGTGFVGSMLCEKLNQWPCHVSVATRRADNARHLQSLPGLEVLEIKLSDSAALAELVAGHDAVVNLIAILHGSEAAFDSAHVQWPLALVQACKTAGVRRLVHLSALGAALDSASKYQRSKARGEAALLNSGLDVTLLRPSVIFGANDKFLNSFAKLQQFFPVIPLAASQARFQPVWVDDVARAAVHCLQETSTIGQIYELCGPDIFSLKQLMQLAGAYAGINHGRGRAVLPLPDALARLQAFVMELAPGDPVLSRDNLDAMKTDNIASAPSAGLLGLSALGIAPSSLTAIGPSYLGTRGRRSELCTLRKTAGRF